MGRLGVGGLVREGCLSLSEGKQENTGVWARGDEICFTVLKDPRSLCGRGIVGARAEDGEQ